MQGEVTRVKTSGVRGYWRCTAEGGSSEQERILVIDDRSQRSVTVAMSRYRVST